MDEKLARGLTRELFRQLTLSTQLETNPRAQTVRALAKQYSEGLEVEDWDLLEVASRFEKDLLSQDDIRTNSRLIRHPVRRKAIVETTFAASITGKEQAWMIALSNTYILEKKSLRIIETAHHVAIAQHAIFRLFERGKPDKFLAKSVLDCITIWAYPLLIALAGKTARTPAIAGTQVAIPYSNGLLLGTLEVNYLEGPDQGPTISTVKMGRQNLRRISPPFAVDDQSILTLSINTFVGRQELFDNQQRVFDALDVFKSRYSDSMKNMRELVAFGYPDDEITKIIGSPEFNSIDLEEIHDLVGLINSSFESAEWKQHAEAHRRPTRYLQ